MSVRVAIGGLMHETNTFSEVPTLLSDFWTWRGDELIREFKGTETYLGGAISGAERHALELVPTLFADAMPGGRIVASDYLTLRDELVARLAEAQPEIVLLALHGAGAAEGIDDLEADLCLALRGQIGEAPLVGLAMDLHGNIVQALGDQVDAICAVREYPHTDTQAAGERVLDLLYRAREHGPGFTVAVEHLPALLAPTLTASGPAAEINDLCREAASKPGVSVAYFFHGFPYADSPVVGASVVVTGEPGSAREAARELAMAVWRRRSRFGAETVSPAEAVARANGNGLVVVNEVSDNPGGGAPGDGTHLLRAIIDAGTQHAAFAMLYDPETVSRAQAAGVGSDFDVELGGKTDALHGEPVKARAHVRSLTDGRFVYQVLDRGVHDDVGPTACLEIGGVQVVVTSERRQVLDTEIFLLHGIDVSRMRLVGLKSMHHFRAAFGPLAKQIVACDSPGLTTYAVEVFPRERTSRPIWPLDETSYPGER